MLQKRKKILLVEDNLETSSLLKEYFTENNYYCIPAYTASEALEKVGSVQPHLILLDLILPMMSGYGVLQELKSDPIVKDIPVIVFTSIKNKEFEKKALDLGATKYLNKGLDLKELISIVERYAA